MAKEKTRPIFTRRLSKSRGNWTPGRFLPVRSSRDFVHGIDLKAQ